ncbi:MAG: mycofactocin biosynthesis peptidyl-dipeptidase MftE, partial [Actinomycetota bacterium]|nr:mycofactocin biosynthesis peptidyl-dipeptidase MftE [Actinomycetota bacterium]
RLGRLRRGQTAPLSELMAALRAGGISSVSANGVLGDPLAASRGRGEELLEELVSDLDRAVISLEEPGGAPS